jgi:hypothetical protein
MTYELVTQPIAGHQAFAELGDAATLSQAAFLLILGNQLRGTPQARSARARAAGLAVEAQALPADDSSVFPVPSIPATAQRFSPPKLRSAASRLTGLNDARAAYRAAPSGSEAVRIGYQALAQHVYEAATPEAAALLLNECVFHEHELVRTAAAAAYCTHAADPAPLVALLAKATKSKDVLVREVAATALARFYPGHAALAALRRARRTRTRRAPSRTSLLVHGTWAVGQPWWQPGGDFHAYVLNEVRPDLYSAADRFEWSGGYSDAARAQGGTSLLDWITGHQLDGLDLFTHSHGGSVAMLATQAGANIGELVLLSCPAHEDKYMPDFGRVAKAVSIRVHADLVILADGGRQRFQDPRISENVLPCWFNHSLTHDPATWEQFNVKDML